MAFSPIHIFKRALPACFALFAALFVLIALPAGCGGGGSESIHNPIEIANDLNESLTEQEPDPEPEPEPTPDTTAPASPSSVSATQYDCEITVSWTNPTDSDFVGSAVIRATDTASFSTIDLDAITPVCDGAITSCQDSGLIDDTLYYYAVVAYDDSGNASTPATASVTCDYIQPPDVTLPETPTNISATQYDCAINVTWSNPTDADFAGIIVRRGDTEYPMTAQAANTASDTSVCSGMISACEDTGLIDAAAYYYSVFAADDAGNYSSPATATVTCEYLPNPPKVSDLSVDEDDCEISLTWTNPVVSDFAEAIVRRASSGYPSDPTASNTKEDAIVCQGDIEQCDDTDLDDGVTYYYSVFTRDTDNYYSVEAAKTFTTCGYDSFRVIAIPDSQYMSLGYPALFNTVTTWIKDNRDKKKIAFVIHEGDMVHNNTVAEWQNASTAMSIMDGIVPYTPAVGNHDYTGSRDTTNFNTYFPYNKYLATDSFGGAYEVGKMDNTYHYFTAGGTDWMVFALEYNPRDEVLAWASDTVSVNSDRRVIIETHAYLGIDNARTSIGGNVWNKLVKLHSNISFVVNGHYLGANGARLVSSGDNGNNVYQMFANYQDLAFGGIGYIRVMKMNPSKNKVTVRTYSPFLNSYKTDGDNDFVFTGVDLSPPQ